MLIASDRELARKSSKPRLTRGNGLEKSPKLGKSIGLPLENEANSLRYGTSTE